MTLKMTKLFYLLALLFSLLICNGCGDPKFNKEGKQFIKELTSQNECYEIFSGVSSYEGKDLNGTSIKKNYINIRLSACKNCLSFDNDDSCSSYLLSIAQKLYNTCENRQKFDGIILKIETNSSSSFEKYFVYELDPIHHSLLLVNKYSNEPAIGFR
jgi:hypothetical protein